MTKKKKTSFVSVDEMLKMKVMDMAGKTQTEIVKATGRGWNTVTRGLENFENLLVGNDELQYKLDKELKALTETMAENAASLIIAGQHQTARKLGEATAIEAAKIVQMNVGMLNGLKQISDKGFGEEVGQSPAVTNFITNVVNITNNNVRPKPTPTNKSRIESDVKRGSEVIVEGVV